VFILVVGGGNEKDDIGRNEKLLELMQNEKNRKVFLISRFSLVDKAGTVIGEDVVKNEFFLADTQ